MKTDKLTTTTPKDALKHGRQRAATRKARLQSQIAKFKPQPPSAVKADYSL